MSLKVVQVPYGDDIHLGIEIGGFDGVSIDVGGDERSSEPASQCQCEDAGQLVVLG